MNKKILVRILAGTLGLCSALPMMAKQKIAPDTPKTGPVQVIITYKADATDANQASVVSKGGSFKAKLKSVKGAAYTVDAAALGTISSSAPGMPAAISRAARGVQVRSYSPVSTSVGFAMLAN
jgi:hypothetical protein